VPGPNADLAGGSPAENAALVEAVLGGEVGPYRDVTVLNAAAGFVAAGRVGSLGEGADLARATLEAGSAAALLERLRAERRAAEAAAAIAEGAGS
jgi:anthranilate phosphoribosyltransferase